MTLVLDAGALLAIERGRRDVLSLIKNELLGGRVPVTHGVVRCGQARVAGLLPGLEIRALDERLGRSAGELLARSPKADVVDAALALLAADGHVVLTSDPSDIAALVEGARAQVDVVRV